MTSITVIKRNGNKEPLAVENGKRRLPKFVKASLTSVSQ